jgi:ABC-type lipoprotein export system ATPase subunit
LITQHTNFLADLPIDEFLRIHAKARNIVAEGTVERTIYLTNKLTGEKVHEKMRMTSLSGGQTRALMIADAIVIGQAPIVLLDEIEKRGNLQEGSNGDGERRRGKSFCSSPMIPSWPFCVTSGWS